MKLLLKNMVCDRCIRVVREELEALGLHPLDVRLGEVEVAGELTAEQLTQVQGTLERSGFELLNDRRGALVEYMKTLIIEEVQHLKGQKPAAMNFSDYLSGKSGYEYSYLSHLFSAKTGTTLEQYLIAQRVEKVKEWLQYDELSVSEMAWRLGYSSAAHLANQFKKLTGQTPGQYRKAAGPTRKNLDEV
jgi:AraC family transcriptional regulator